MRLREERIPQAKEAVGIYEQLGKVVKQAGYLLTLASLLRSSRQLDAAEEVASRATGLLPDHGEFLVTCRVHRIPGEIWYDKGETKKKIHHF